MWQMRHGLPYHLLQVADDFSQLSLDVPPQFRQLAHTDEHNLVYVAVTRAMLGLVCNRDVAKLISSKARKTLQIQVGVPAPWSCGG